MGKIYKMDSWEMKVWQYLIVLIMLAWIISIFMLLMVFNKILEAKYQCLPQENYIIQEV